ncbi:MAG: hypothetical protein KDI68_05650 [Gammaproteobacteria bacterium]|nr:hypothetical protein [Gammaproteobacteria bacterium]
MTTVFDMVSGQWQAQREAPSEKRDLARDMAKAYAPRLSSHHEQPRMTSRLPPVALIDIDTLLG